MRTPAVFAAILASTLAAASNADVLDQHDDGPLSGGTSIGVITTAINQSAAETITVGITGTLTRVEMYVYAGGTLTAPLVLEVRTVDGSDVSDPPAEQVLASQQVTPPPSGLQWVSFDLSASNLHITSGEHLSLVLRSAQDLTVGQYDAEGSQDVYPGASFYRNFTNPWIELDNYDLMFHTYVAAGGPTCGSADFNCDGATGTDADIESFFACLSGDCPPPPCTSSADFNGDGATGTDADIEAFFRVLAGGSC
jgi:hypothetical protein